MTCELFSECPFPYQSTSQHPVSSPPLVESCCKVNPLRCARRRVAVTVSHEKVPFDLLPDQFNRVLGIVCTVRARKQTA